MYEMMTCPHCREEIPRRGCGKHLIECAKEAKEYWKRLAEQK